jgi:uncharacterized membrane-anchored protein
MTATITALSILLLIAVIAAGVGLYLAYIYVIPVNKPKVSKPRTYKLFSCCYKGTYKQINKGKS